MRNPVGKVQPIGCLWVNAICYTMACDYKLFIKSQDVNKQHKKKHRNPQYLYTGIQGTICLQSACVFTYISGEYYGMVHFRGFFFCSRNKIT